MSVRTWPAKTLLIGRRLAYEHVEGTRGNREGPRLRRGSLAERWRVQNDTERAEASDAHARSSATSAAGVSFPPLPLRPPRPSERPVLARKTSSSEGWWSWRCSTLRFSASRARRSRPVGLAGTQSDGDTLRRRRAGLRSEQGSRRRGHAPQDRPGRPRRSGVRRSRSSRPILRSGPGRRDPRSLRRALRVRGGGCRRPATFR